MEDSTSREHIDRIPVLISFGGEKQLLAFSKFLQRTREAPADAILTPLNEWGIASCINSLSFNTNTFNKNP